MKKLEIQFSQCKDCRFNLEYGDVNIGSKRLPRIWLLRLSYDKTNEENPTYFDKFKLDGICIEKRMYLNISVILTVSPFRGRKVFKGGGM